MGMSLEDKIKQQNALEDDIAMSKFILPRF